jgi:chemotaxis regulatin CheY-phosphate phosphatase CheZ
MPGNLLMGNDLRMNPDGCFTNFLSKCGQANSASRSWGAALAALALYRVRRFLSEMEAEFGLDEKTEHAMEAIALASQALGYVFNSADASFARCRNAYDKQLKKLASIAVGFPDEYHESWHAAHPRQR